MLVFVFAMFLVTSTLCEECHKFHHHCRAQAKNPHIIMIVVDDLGWNDVSFHGSPQIPTPNMDALAADGVVLTNYYVLPICTPSRSALLSGYYPIHTGMQHDVIYGQQPYGLPLNLTLLPQHLNSLGYASHAVGKWHLGFFQKEYTPTFRGFESHFGYWLGHECYYDHTALENTAYGLDFRDNLDPVWESGGHYATEIFTEKAVNVIKRHNTSQPLFLYLSHLGVHGGNGYSVVEAPAKYIRRFPHIADVERRIFAGMVAAVDDSVGQVLRALSEYRMLHNSIVILTTDNGGASGGIDGSKGSNCPLRGTKYTLWQGGVRGTAVLWHPSLNRTSPQRDQMMHIADWLPTLYKAAGGDVSKLGPIDGMDMWDPLINNRPSPRREVLLNIDPLWQVAALVKGRYKIVSGVSPFQTDSWYGPSGRDKASMALFPKLPRMANYSLAAQTLRRAGRHFQPPTLKWYDRFNVSCLPVPTEPGCKHPNLQPCLFDLEKDPCEYEDIAASYPEIVADMMATLEFYNATSVPPANKPIDPRADPKNFGFLWSSWM